MSFRHTIITEFVYRGGKPEDIGAIHKVLNEYGHFEWRASSMEGLGYFHGVIKDLDSHETRDQADTIIADILERAGVKIAIVFE